MSFDFSQVNLQYFIQARDLAKQDPELVATMIGMGCPSNILDTHLVSE